MKVIVTATREQLHEMGICSERTFERLLSGVPIDVTKEDSGSGRDLVYLWPEYCAYPPRLWVYKEYTKPC